MEYLLVYNGGQQARAFEQGAAPFDFAEHVNDMALILKYSSHKSFWEGVDQQEILAETRLNLLALEYGYKYRLDIRPKNSFSRIEFVRTLREARFVGMRIRKSGGMVGLFKIHGDGKLTRHQW